MLDASEAITSSKNPLVKRFRKLHQAKERHRQGRFLLEGTHLIQEACAVAYPLEQVAATDRWCHTYPGLLAQLASLGIPTRLVNADVLQTMCTTASPDGVAAIALRQLPTEPAGTPRLGIALERLQDPGNLGTIIRTAAAAGCDRVWLTADSVDPDHPKVLRSTAGQWFRLPMQTVDSLQQLAAFKDRQVQLVATTASAELSYWQLDLRQPTIFLMGNEGGGLSPAAQELATHCARIPLAAGVESLNVAIATALLLYEARRQQSWT